jgi:ABC-type Fe3+/spermidine/putrescine transport system ATPase subunit
MDKLQVVAIEKTYEGSPLLKGISFEVKTGEVLCLLGRSGSGKSTLLRIIAGIESAERGRVLWNGEDMCEVPTHLRRFGLMFQDYALFPHLNVHDNVAFGLKMQGEDKETIDRKVTTALEQVNLADFGNRGVADLSGGEQQRVALARALAPEPRLLMLDEPLAALDRALRAQLQEELREVLHRTDIPAIYVTHDQDEALALGDRIALLNEGEIVQIGTPEEVYRRPKNEWVAQFLGMENIFEGKVVRLEPFTVSTGFGELEVGNHPKEHIAIGGTVKVVLLSMDAEISARGENTIPLTVVESVFKGDHYRTVGKNERGQTLVLNLKGKTRADERVILRLDRINLYCLSN